MKKYIIILILILIGAVAYLSYQNKQLTTKYETSIENVKAYDAQLSGLEGDNRVLKLTVEQLNYFNDSIIKKMKVVQKELGIRIRDYSSFNMKPVMHRDMILLF